VYKGTDLRRSGTKWQLKLYLNDELPFHIAELSMLQMYASVKRFAMI